MTRKTPYLFLITIIIFGCSQRETVKSANIIKVHADQPVGQLNKIWQFYGYDEGNYTFSKEGKGLLTEIAKISHGTSHIRCHHLLTSGDGSTWLKWSSTNVYMEDAQNNAVYNWTLLDSIFDTYIELGLKPYVQLGFMPKDLSSEPEPYTPGKITYGKPTGMVSGGAFYPPKDYNKWKNLVEEVAWHCADRYGIEEASSWYWELWNEPNIGYWKGTDQEYFKLYDYTVAALKATLPDARFGGPHIASPGWKNGSKFLEDFITHCISGTNYLTGEVGAEIDFFATHAKGGTSWEEDHVRMNLSNQLRQVDMAAEIIARYPEMKDKPLIIGESDPDGCAACSGSAYPSNGYRNGSQYAAYTAATFLRKQEVAARHGVNLEGAITWAFAFPDQPWFDGFRALSTNGVEKPVFNAFRMFAKLENERVRVTNPFDQPLDSLIENSVRNHPDIGCVATRSDSALAIIVWNYHDRSNSDTTVKVSLEIAGLEAFANATLVHYRIDSRHSNAHSAWLEMGSPDNPTSKQIGILKESSALTILEKPGKIRVKDGRYDLSLELESQAVSLIRLERN